MHYFIPDVPHFSCEDKIYIKKPDGLTGLGKIKLLIINFLLKKFRFKIMVRTNIIAPEPFGQSTFIQDRVYEVEESVKTENELKKMGYTVTMSKPLEDSYK